jgi:pilus assembly protein Flp/PilA
MEALAIAGWNPAATSKALAQEQPRLANAGNYRGSGESHMLRVRNFLSDESGVTAIEYALIASLIAVFIIVAVQLVGTNLSTVFSEVGNTLK